MIEEWRKIKGFEDYEISNLGRVKSLKYGKEKIMKPAKDKDRYLYVHLYQNKKTKCYRVHRLVAQAFLLNPNNYPDINHKDEDKTNNCVSNIEYCSKSYNNSYGTRTERASKAKSIPVVQTDMENNYINVYQSARQVQRELGFNKSNIARCCKGKTNKVNGYKWYYLKDREFLSDLPIVSRKEKILSKREDRII